MLAMCLQYYSFLISETEIKKNLKFSCPCFWGYTKNRIVLRCFHVCCDIEIFWGLPWKWRPYPNFPMITGKIQKQAFGDVLRKRCSENMQQIYRRKTMPKYWNRGLLLKIAFFFFWDGGGGGVEERGVTDLNIFWIDVCLTLTINIFFIFFRTLVGTKPLWGVFSYWSHTSVQSVLETELTLWLSSDCRF